MYFYPFEKTSDSSDLFHFYEYLASGFSCRSFSFIKDLGEGHCLVRVNTTQKYLLLPVEDASPDVRISMIADNKEVKSFVSVWLLTR